MPALRFKTCRLLSGNVWNRELTIIQRRILQRLRNKKRSMLRKIYSRENLNSYIQSQTTRKLSLFHGDLPITEMHRRRKRSTIPFLLNPETRSDVIPVRLHFRETIPQARQPISHRRVCVNNRMVNIIHFKVSHGELISLKENDAREIRRSFYIEISVEKIIGKFLDRPVRMWRRTKTEWFRKLKTLKECRLLLKSKFLLKLRSSIQEEDRKKFGSKKVCFGSYFDEHNRMKRNLYHFKSLFLSKRRSERNGSEASIEAERNTRSEYRSYGALNISVHPTQRKTIHPIVYNSSLYSNSTYYSASPHQFTMKRKIKRIELPTHYLEVNHRTPKAVISYGPNIGHIPHDIRLKDPNLLLRSGNERGQNNVISA
uniref:Ribosomal protein S4 n=1 Tax=Utricularia gibba TaxID=13748 RepID=R4QVP2_UTRGI|nr:ribosomal protein S4 [Utricularia gibba]